jgi:AcrR family transcriptional regulator
MTKIATPEPTFAPVPPPGAKARRALKDAAIALIAERGLGGATVRATAARAGVSKSLAGHHFKSQALLLAAVADELLATPAPAADDEAELVRVACFCQDLLAEAAADPVRGRALLALLGAAHGAAAQGRAIAGWQHTLLMHFHGLLRAGQARGTIRGDVDARTQAVLLLGSVYGALWLALTRERLDAEALGEGLLAWVIAGLNPKLAPPPAAAPASPAPEPG